MLHRGDILSSVNAALLQTLFIHYSEASYSHAKCIDVLIKK